ncbi:unnamed protein product [Hymenolepis diminuta]|uniref:Uncharacterized protein n=1 Tax=Hymenolepis diminuta TaxID=6216 RepID=A0A564YBB8_HYMDI|nr:unnamed protein product [Hymenolepis diminuta]
MSDGSSSFCREDICELIDEPLKELYSPPKQIDGNIWTNSAKLHYSSQKSSNIDWPTVEEFTTALGAEAISLFIKVNHSHLGCLV